jgi:hypothetical protein
MRILFLVTGRMSIFPDRERIRTSTISVSGAVCLAKNLSPENAGRCDDLTLKRCFFLTQGGNDCILKKECIVKYLRIHTQLILIIKSFTFPRDL